MADCLTLCATTRLAQTLRGAAPDGRTVWRTRRALTVGQWLASLADEALLTGIDDLPSALDLLAMHVVQVIISDAHLPVMDGSELLAKVRALYPDTVRMM
ncbi:MAG: hypothetical protein J0M01_18210, partial [Dechloromonas sp.]|nr:hypothetical protein [Dechloromonas sp.]